MLIRADFSETSWTAEKIYTAFTDKRINHVSLVDINISVFNNSVEALYSYRVFHQNVLLSFLFAFLCKIVVYYAKIAKGDCNTK